VSGKDNKEVESLMKQLNSTGKYEVKEDIKKVISDEFYAGCVFKDETEETIKNVYEKHGYLLDTHTAVAYKTLEKYKTETNDKTVSVVLSTASPYKFSKSVYEALYKKTDSDEFQIMQELSEKTGVNIPENLKGLKEKTVLHKEVCEKDEMENYVKKIANK
jgi:threonine synthase